MTLTISRNPIHGLIEKLNQYIAAVWKCHHASTKEVMDATLKNYQAVVGSFWPTSHFPSDAQRGLAHRALSWCSRRGFRSPEHIAAIENGANFITALAMLNCPCALPHVYSESSRQNAETRWNREGIILLGAYDARDALKRLAALAGEEWQGEGVEVVAPGTSEDKTMYEENIDEALVLGEKTNPPIYPPFPIYCDIRFRLESNADYGKVFRCGLEPDDVKDLDRFLLNAGRLCGNPTWSSENFDYLDNLLRVHAPGSDIYGLRLKTVADVMEAEWGRIRGAAASRDRGGAEQEERGTLPNKRRKPIPAAEAEIRVRDWLAQHAKENPAAVTRDGVAARTGVSKGQVNNTAAWKAFKARRDAERSQGCGTCR